MSIDNTNFNDFIIDNEFQAKTFFMNLSESPDFESLMKYTSSLYKIEDFDKRLISVYYFQKSIYDKYEAGFDVELIQRLKISLENIFWGLSSALEEYDGIAYRSPDIMRFFDLLKNDPDTMSRLISSDIVRDKSDVIIFYLYFCTENEQIKNILKNLIFESYSSDMERCIDFTSLPIEAQDVFFMAAADQFQKERLLDPIKEI